MRGAKPERGPESGRKIPNPDKFDWDRINVRLDPDTMCLEQQGPAHHNGYKYVQHEGRCVLLHRLAYTVTYGQIPKGHTVRHLCDNPRCVNPDHLTVGTQAENNLDRIGRPTKSKRKLAREEIAAILWDTEGTIAERAERWDVTPNTIYRLKREYS